MPSGKSKSSEYPNGVRRIVNGRKLAPRSIRKRCGGKKCAFTYLDGCSDRNLKKALIERD